MRKYVSIVLFLCIINGSYAQTTDELGMKIIGFCALASLTDATQDSQTCDAIGSVCHVGEKIETIDRGLSKAFAFVKAVQQLHLGDAGSYQGRSKRSEGPGTLVFVTDPIPTLNKGVLVFVSTTAPSRVAIFFMDPEMRGELIYDSVNKPAYFIGAAETAKTPIEAIGKISVNREGSIQLLEYSEAKVSNLSRRFEISFVHGDHPQLRIIGSSVTGLSK